MATQQSAAVQVLNLTGGTADITLSHNNSTNGTQTQTWNDVSNNNQTSPLTVYFETGAGVRTVKDYWWISILVQDGPNAGQYVSSAPELAVWRECQLQSADANQNQPMVFSVTTQTFFINIPSGGIKPAMQFVAPYSAVSKVFVVMLENHSFDNIFAMSGIPGIMAANTDSFNNYQDVNYFAKKGAPVTMSTDPGHEFLDVFQQLTGQPGSVYTGNMAYQINNSGFVTNYATTKTEGNTPDFQNWGDIMACFDTPNQLPVIYQLATEFAICDSWFSSLPGPTWPNRFFVHGASSAGLDDSPSGFTMGTWEKGVPWGFTYPNGSIYDALTKGGIKWQLYADKGGEFSDDPQDSSWVGGIAQVSSITNITTGMVKDLYSNFANDLQSAYPYSYTFIEPNYGNALNNSYQGGSSQHPMDDVYGGESLLKYVYESIRNSPYWNNSVLIIIYDEHGGFYDSVRPPAAPTPNDGSNNSHLNTHGFQFNQYGLRIPAVIVSPRIAQGIVDTTIYDHASVLATLERIFNIPPLTDRDAKANDLLHLFSETTPRTDCPTTLNNPAPPVAPQTLLSADDLAALDQKPLPPSGNLVGFLQILLKTELELSTGEDVEKAALVENFKKMKTFGDAKVYAASVKAKFIAAGAL